MVERLIEASVRNRFLVLILTALCVMGAVWSMNNIPLDAIPDLSDTQVIVYSKWDRSPDLMEDQVTYPIISALLGVPGIKAVRGFSDFGFSYVYVIFKDGTDMYWARSRVLEYLSKITPRLPSGVQTELGPDATGVGWVFQYALVDPTGKHSLHELRSFQDWNLRYQLQSVPGVSEVASLGGFVKQYQVTVDPNVLIAHNLSISKITDALRHSNEEAGGRLIERAGAEYMVRGHGYLKGIQDIKSIGLGVDDNGTPIRLGDIAHVDLGGDLRRGIMDIDGRGDAVGGTIIMRSGENALKVIDRVKHRLEELKPSFPDGVELRITYDRSDLIKRAIATLKKQLIEEIIIVSLVVLIFLWHFPSAITPILTIPVAVIVSFIPMAAMKLTSNIMSLAGIAISIGVLVDGAIVQMENVYKNLEHWDRNGRLEDYRQVFIRSIKEVGPSVFFALLVIAVSFLPIFTLIDQEGRLFKPLAWSKTFAMALAAILAVTFDPALRMWLLRVEPFKFKNKHLNAVANTVFVGKYYPEEKHPVSRILFRIYEPICRWVLNYPKAVIACALLLLIATVPIYFKLGSEFMPPLWEGDLLYMPTTMPGISIAEAQKLLIKQDQILMSFPEVKNVFGKAGRLDSSTDPAPLSMIETIVQLKPQSEWPAGENKDALINKFDAALKIPGTSNAWTMPIKNRIDMLSTGVRTPLGIKVMGGDLKTIEEISIQIEALLKNLSGTRSVFAERTTGGYFVDFDLKREALARYGLTVADAQETLLSAIGGEDVTTTIEGRERYSVNVRYPRELRGNVDALKSAVIATPSGQHIPMMAIADIKLNTGPSMIRDENGLLTGYVYVDIKDSDVGSYVAQAKRIVASSLKLPTGYSLAWSGQYENMIRVKERLKVVVPLTILLIAFLLYFNTKSIINTGIVLLSVPFSLIGAVWLLWALGYNMSIAVWVGMIALMGLDAETGVLLLLFLEMAYKDAKNKGAMGTHQDLKEAIIYGSVRRLRPKLMTVMAAFMGLLPIMWSMGAGADVMKRIAAPMVGGLITSFALGLIVYPAIYYLWKKRSLI